VRAARRFPPQIFSSDFLFHTLGLSNQPGHPAAICGQKSDADHFVSLLSFRA
jgi:hypothetical protein